VFSIIQQSNASEPHPPPAVVVWSCVHEWLLC